MSKRKPITSHLSTEEDLMGFISVMLQDKSKFKFAFKSTTTSDELIQQACERAGVHQTQFFGLKRLRNQRAEIEEDAIPKIWISEKLPLSSQGCDSSTVLYLKHKYWFHDVEEIVDATTLQLIFDETNEKLMTHEYDCNEDSNLQLAACRVQLIHGDFSKDKPVLKPEDLKQYLPEYIHHLHPFEDWERLIGVFHDRLKGLGKEQIQKKFLILAKEGAPSIEVAYFPAQYSTREMESKVTILVGVTPEGVGFYSNKNNRKKLQVFHRYRELTSWHVNAMWNGLEAPDFSRPAVPHHPNTDILINNSSSGNHSNGGSHSGSDPSSPISPTHPSHHSLTVNLHLSINVHLNDYRNFESNPYTIGPYRSTLFLKTKSKRTKDIEIELASFISEDDTIVSFLDTYHNRLEQFLSIASLDDGVKETFVQVVTLDGMSKKIKIASDMNGQELITIFAEKIGLHDTAFFQLSAVTDGHDKWISLKDPIVGEGLSENLPLTLKLRFFWKNPAEITDPVAKNLYFVQINKSVINGDFLVVENDAIELSSLLLHYTYGPHNNNRRYAYMSEVSIKDYIPYYLLPAHSHSSWEKKIVAAHEKIKELTKEEAQARYLLTASTLPNYGITFFSGIIPKTNEECYIGIGKLGLALYKQTDLTLIAGYRFGYELRHYVNDGEAISLKVKPSRHAEEKTLIIVSLQFAQIIDLMGYYEKMRRFDKKLKEQEDENDSN